jgi:phage host-nuclease inhibitor protein Gam
MITIKERKAIKNILGNHYTNHVIATLKAKKIVSASGKTHSSEFIRQVFNGYREHLEIEGAILEATAIEKKYARDLKRKKDKLLKSESTAEKL